MNAFLQKAFEYLNFFIAHPSESTIIFFTALVLSILILNYLYRERIATLEERVKLRDDRVEFYKDINTELEKKISASRPTGSSIESSQENSQPEDATQEVPQSANQLEEAPQEEQQYETNLISQSILDAIVSRNKDGLPASSMQIIQPLQSKYNLGDILSELVRLHHNGKLTWDNAPTFPEHWMELKMQDAP